MPKAPAPVHEERLRIRAFGPIAEADITVRPLTVLIGPQASGKSLTAQLLYFMRGLEEVVGPQLLLEHDLAEILRSWIDPTLLTLAASEATRISWQTSGIEDEEYEFSTEALTHRGVEFAVNSALRQRLIHVGSAKDLLQEQQIYIPAGRLLCSLVPPWLGLSLLARQRLPWPGYLGMFYEKLGHAIALLPTDRSQLDLFAAPLGQTLASKSLSSLRGQLSRGPRDVRLSFEDRQRRGAVVTTAIGGGFASGQLETWPLWTLLQAHLPSDGIKRIFIEEPEAHLHPSAQRDTVEALVMLLQHRFRFVLTTHSPYVLYALNNALLAGQVKAAKKKLPKAFPKNFVLSSEQISAYRFTQDGHVHSLFDQETGLLDAAELDDPAAALSAEFSDLEDALYRDKR